MFMRLASVLPPPPPWWGIPYHSPFQGQVPLPYGYTAVPDQEYYETMVAQAQR